jgi:polysaccharide biosynthesis/export protein
MRSHCVHRLVGQTARGMAVSPLLLLSMGCASAWWNSFIDPTQVGNFRENRMIEVQDTVSFEDKPTGIPNAVDPSPDDVIATVEDYRLGPGDVIQARLLDFLARGAESEFVLTVSDTGAVDVPQLGLIQVDGLSLPEVRAELARQAQAKGIFRPDVEPTITLSMLSQQNRTFNISGAVQAPGPYPIPRSDFRLKEALNLSGGLENGLAGNVWQQQYVAVIYVFRNQPREKRVLETPVREPDAGASVPGGPPKATGASSDQPSPLGNPVLPETTKPAASQPILGPRAGRLAVPAEEAEQDLINAVAPTSSERVPEQSRPASTPSTGGSSSLRPFIFVNAKLIESPATQQAPPPPSTAEAPQPATQETVDWRELAAEEGQPRIIRIPADALRSGDESYNIVIHRHDWIRVDPGPTGNYYIGGHVVQPGSYPLYGQQVTLTQAVIAARGLDPLAWPTRCEVRRRIDRDREQLTQWDLSRIMAGQDPDLFLKPNDVINIGTHSIAPFLYTIRNSFRFSYGAAFTYDRNWAEFDTLAGQYYRARTTASNRGLLSAFDF